jgi:hypothetical protein
LILPVIHWSSQENLESKARLSRLQRDFLLSWQKEAKPLLAGRDPPLRGGPLRFSEVRARRPNSLRSDKGASSARTSCDARLALRLRQESESKGKDRARARATAKATPTAKPTATATAEARFGQAR